MCVFARCSISMVLMFCIGGVLDIVDARPAIIHEQDRVPLPAPYGYALDVCLSGEDLLVLAVRGDPTPEDPYRNAWTIVHFARQAGGEWLFTEELAATSYDTSADIWMYPQLACDGPIAGFSTPGDGGPGGDSFILERTASGWIATSLGHIASDVAVYGDSVAFGGEWGGSPTSVAVYKKDASGAWADVRYAIGHPGYRDDIEIVGPEAIGLASAELVATGDGYIPAGQPYEHVYDTQVFDLIDDSWQLTATLPVGQSPTIWQPRPVGTVGDQVALLMDMWTEPGDVGSFFTRDASGAWTVKHTLLSDELFTARNIVISEGRVFEAGYRDVGEIIVFREEAPRRYRHEATLIPSDRVSSRSGIASAFSVHGEWVAAVHAFQSTVYLFRVPATLPAPYLAEETFEDNTAEGWSVWGDAADWRIVSSGSSRVYQQRNTQAGSRSILETSAGTDQSVQADVRITSGAGPSPWAGLIVRYVDTQNFYYLLVNSDSVQIRRIVDGAFGPIATAPFDLVLGRTYRFRLEAIGARLRAFVNGEMVAEVIDDTHAQGRAGLAMWRAVTEYDNVVVTSNPQVELFADSFDSEHQLPWSSAPSSAWSYVPVGNNERVYRQSSTTGSTRAIHGGPAEDQIVTAKIEPRAFNASGRGSAGLILRYIDPHNFYYARLTDTNRIILGMQVNGSHHTIDRATIAVNTDTTYSVRAEAIGNSLRVYVNDRLMGEGQDSTFSSGRYGLVTFHAAADFDDFKVIRP